MKHRNLKITTAVAAGISMAACSPTFDENAGWKAPENTAVCTDKQGKRVDDSKCRTAGGHSNAFLWYYLMAGSRVPASGERVTGGSFARPAGKFTPAGASARVIARGGFGSSSHFAVGG